MTDPSDILRPLTVPDNVKADVWDAFTQAKDENDLAVRIKSLAIPDSAKADLWDLKHSGNTATVAPVAPDQPVTQPTTQPPTATPAKVPATPSLPPTNPLYTYRETLNGIGDSASTAASTLATGAKDFAKGSLESLGSLDEDPIGTLYNAAKGIAGAPSALVDALRKFHEGRTSGDAQKMSEGASDFIFKAAPALLGLEGAVKPGLSALDSTSPVDVAARAGEAIDKHLDSPFSAETRAASDAVLKKANPQSFQPWSNTVGDLFKTKGNQTEFDAVNRTFDDAAQYIQANAKRVLGEADIRSVRAFNHVGKITADETYQNEILKPAAQVDAVDLKPYGQRIIDSIPSYYSPAERAALIRDVQAKFFKSGKAGNGVVSGTDTAMLLKQFNAANEAHVNATTYAKSTAESLPNGYMLRQATDAARDALSDAVKRVDPTADIPTSLRKYGNITEMVQRAGGDIPIDPSLMDMFTKNSYITGVTPNFYGRVSQALTSKWTASDAMMKRAMAAYKATGPLPKPPTASFPSAPKLALPPVTNSPTVGNTNIFYSSDPVRGVEAMRNVTQSSSAPGMGIPLTDITQRTAQPNQPLQLPEITSTTPINASWERRQPGQPMPAVTASTRINQNALRGANPAQPAITSGPFRFTMPMNAPTEIKVGSAAESPRVIARSTDASGTMSNTYPPNWQLDSTVRNGQPLVDGKPTTTNAGGPGTLITTDPKVVESTIAQYDKLIKSTKVKTKLDILQSQRDALVKQLLEYNKQRSTK